MMYLKLLLYYNEDIEKDEISPCLHFYDLVLRWNIYLKGVILYLFLSSKSRKIPLNSLHKQMDT